VNSSQRTTYVCRYLTWFSLFRTPGVDVNAADNIGSTPLHEAVNASQEEAVKLLLDYQPLPTLDRYVTGAAGGSRPAGCVDLTAMAGAEEKFTPLQDAVEAGNINIVTIILGMWGTH
jgi:ankyrin repeat protein